MPSHADKDGGQAAATYHHHAQDHDDRDKPGPTGSSALFGLMGSVTPGRSDVRWQRRRRARDHRRTASRMGTFELLQVVITVVVAGVVASSALLASDANGGRQDGVRQEIKRSAATIEDIREVYGIEAPLAFRISVARLRATELKRAAEQAGLDGSVAAVDAVVQEQTAFRFAAAEKGTGSLADGDRYSLADGGFDVVRRLADVRRENPGLVALDPQSTQADADRDGGTAQIIAAACGVLTVTYAGLVLAAGFRRRHRGHGGGSDIGLIPQPGDVEPTRRQAVILALLAWAFITVLPAFQTHFDDAEQRNQALAARSAQAVVTDIAVSNLREGFVAECVRAELALDLSTTARELGVLDGTDVNLARAEAVAVAADREALGQVKAVRVAMTVLPAAGDPVDEVTRAGLASRLPTGPARRPGIGLGTSNTRHSPSTIDKHVLRSHEEPRLERGADPHGNVSRRKRASRAPVQIRAL